MLTRCYLVNNFLLLFALHFLEDVIEDILDLQILNLTFLLLIKYSRFCLVRTPLNRDSRFIDTNLKEQKLKQKKLIPCNWDKPLNWDKTPKSRCVRNRLYIKKLKKIDTQNIMIC